jgi:hypothetical protein
MRAFREQKCERPDIRGTTSHATGARLTEIPFCCPTREHQCVDSLSCLYFNQAWSGIERGVMAHCTAIRVKPENTRFHSPLGNTPDLARHLILRVLAVPA